jgi:hypothetical protein
VKDKPELLDKIVYPGARTKPGVSPPSKSSPKVKSAIKARRRASTGSLLQPILDPFDVAVSSIAEPIQEFDELAMLDISPMPIRKTLKLPCESPMFTKDFTNWLSDTKFVNDDIGISSQSTHGLPSPPTGPASVVSNSSQHPPPPPISNGIESPVIVGSQKPKPFQLVSRRHSCIASIHSSSSYNVPLNDVGLTTNKNTDFDSMPIGVFRASNSSYNRVVTDDDVLRSQNTQNFTATMPKVQQQLQQQSMQHFVGGFPSHPVGTSVDLKQQQQHAMQNFVGGSSSHVGPKSDPRQQLTSMPNLPMPIFQQQQSQQQQQQQPQQQQEQQLPHQHQQSHRSSFQDELDDLFRFSREFTLEDFLKDSH